MDGCVYWIDSPIFDVPACPTGLLGRLGEGYESSKEGGIVLADYVWKWGEAPPNVKILGNIVENGHLPSNRGAPAPYFRIDLEYHDILCRTHVGIM
jgi:hypothetical protein